MQSIDIKRDQVCDRTASWEGTSIEERATGWRTSSLVRTHIHILEIVNIAIFVQQIVSASGIPQTHWLFLQAKPSCKETMSVLFLQNCSATESKHIIDSCGGVVQW